ncbi:MAG: MFS transporter [Imperialibacter sp.]|uniref:MFS transporter n=1 Tax=Imperialibacter sp. TaxID=2038411 RepID=UPI0032EC5DAE
MELTASVPSTSGEIHWKQLWSLVALYASVIIGWIAYYNYQPILLHKYNFTDLTLFLFVAQGIIMVVTPPIAGLLGDRFRKSKGNRLPIISAGISAAAMVFMSVAFTLIMDPGETFKWILPILIVFWLASMSIFTSPAISTIDLFAPANKLPRAMAIITIVYGALYALEPVIVDLVDFLGAPLTFVVGGVITAGSGLLMKKNMGKTLDGIVTDVKKEDKKKSDYTYAFIVGLAFGISTTILFNMFPGWLEPKIGHVFDINSSVIISVVLFLSAVFSLPISRIVEKRPLYISLLVSVVAIFAIIFAIYFVENSYLTLILLLLFSFFYSMVSVCGLPLALSVVNDKNKVFGVGIFFAGFELPNGILEAILVAQGLY